MSKHENIAEMLRKKRDLIDSIGQKIERNNEQAVSEPDLSVNFLSDDDELQVSSDLFDERRSRLKGEWILTNYTIEDEDFKDFLLRTRFKGKSIDDFVMEIRYVFRGNLCIKTLEVRGNIEEGRELLPLDYRVKITLSFEVVNDSLLRLVAESGYLYQIIGECNPVMRDYAWNGKTELVHFEFEDENTMILTENGGKEVKQMVRFSSKEESE